MANMGILFLEILGHMNKYANIYFQEFKVAADAPVIQTSIPNETEEHLISRIYGGGVDVPKMLDNATNSKLNVPGVYSPVVKLILSKIKKNPSPWMDILKNKIKPDTVKGFIDRNPSVFDNVSASVNQLVPRTA